MHEAHRLMAETTIINPFNPQYEISEANYVQLGMLAATWIVGCVAACICLCCNTAGSGENSTIPSVAEAAKQKKREELNLVDDIERD